MVTESVTYGEKGVIQKTYLLSSLAENRKTLISKRVVKIAKKNLLS